jgi:hypothetical protein
MNLQYPLSSPLNKGNVKKFIAASASDARDAVRKFIKSTTHISFETFIAYINHNLVDVIQQIQEDRPIFVYINNSSPDYRERSYIWLSLYINELAKEKYDKTVHILTHLDKRNLKDDDIVLLVDDCIYSGMQMSSTITSINNPRQKRLHFILFVPFLSYDGCDNVIESFDMNPELNDCTISLSDHVFYIAPLSHYMSEDEYMSILRYYHDYEGKPFRLSTDAEDNLKKFPIYFDHKVADYVSSFPEIYGGLVPNEHNLQNIKEIDALIKEGRQNLGKPKTEEWKQHMTMLQNNFQIHPLITHCEHLAIPEFKKSSCPVPPYKKQLFDEFIQLVNKKPRNVNSASRKQSSSLRISQASTSPVLGTTAFTIGTKRSLSLPKSK